MANSPRYGVTQTLLGGEPDTNSRTIIDSWNGFCEVATFNREMAVWTAADQRLLKLVVDALNAGGPGAG
jgi:hypothetical protein